MDRLEYIYYRFMKKVVEDDYISLDESGLVMILEERLGLSDDRMDEIMGMIEDGETPETGDVENEPVEESEHLFEKDIFEKVLNEACGDEKITDRELDILEELAGIMGITMEERREIYENVKCDADVSRRLANAFKLD